MQCIQKLCVQTQDCSFEGMHSFHVNLYTSLVFQEAMFKAYIYFAPQSCWWSKHLWNAFWIWQSWLSWSHLCNPPPLRPVKQNPKHSLVLLYLPASISYPFFRKRGLPCLFSLTTGLPRARSFNVDMVLPPRTQSPNTIPQSHKERNTFLKMFGSLSFCDNSLLLLLLFLTAILLPPVFFLKSWSTPRA